MAIYFFDKNQTLIKIVPESATFEAIQTQELDDDSLLKDTLSVTVKGDEKLLNAEYMAVKSYTGNVQTFDMYRIVTDTTPDKSMSFTGMSLAPYELNGHILQDLRPANHSLSYTLNRVLDGTDWRVGYIDDSLSNVTTTFYYVSVKEALKELQSLVGCEFVFKVEISGQKITDKWIEVYSEMGNRTKKRFNYGTNALTVVRETNKADIYTALIGRGKGEEVSSGEDNESGQAGYGRKITFEDIEWSTANGKPLNKPVGQYYLELPQATQAYGIKNIDGTMKARVGIVDFDDEEDKNRLINLTYQQLLVSSRPKVLFKTTVANVGATGIGDTVTIHRHDLNIHYQTRVRKIVRNKLNDNKTQIELGDAVVTASTKQTKQNNATIKNLNNEIDKIKANVTTSQNSADGKNTIFYGSAEPERQRTGDTWYRPHPSIAGETQMLTWNGTAWELVLDTSDLTSVSRAVEEAAEKADEAVQSAKDADTKANDALVKAGANANLLNTHQNTLNTIKNTTLPDINKSLSDAMAEAKKADGKIADYVTKNGLVSGTTVDSKIDTATGEISKKITTVESKIPTEIGGRNYFSLTNLNKIQPTNWAARSYIYNFKLKPNTAYTLSSNVPDQGGDTSKTNIYFNGRGTSERGVWKGKSVTNTSDDNGNIYVAIPTGRPYTQDILDGKYWVQLEKGTIKTDWSPAPEDNLSQSEFQIFESTYNEDVKGINSTLTDLSTKKLDGTTYTDFYTNEYKKTAQGVTDTYAKVNKIIDANGNSTDAFAKAVYDRNATRQSASFNKVTKNLVTTATYTAGINGVKDSITSVRGDLDSLKIGRENLIVRNTLLVGYYIDGSGKLVRSGGNTNVTTDWIEIGDAKEMTFTTYDKYEGRYAGRVAFYSDKNESNFISVVADYSGSSPIQSYTFDVPTGAKYARVTVIYGETLRYKLEKGNISTDWTPAPEDMLGKETFTLFKNDYDETAERVENRLTAIDSGKEGSFAYRLNETESTANGNKTTISNIKTKPGEQITGYQTIKERSDLYERVIGSSSEADVKSKMSRIVMTDSLFQTEVRNSVSIGGENLINRNTLQIGYYLSSFGELKRGGGDPNVTTDWIDINGTKELTFTTFDKFDGAFSGRLALYSDKNESSFISSPISYSNSTPTQSRTVDVPTNAKYARATIIYGDTLRYKLERGNVPTDYTDSTRGISSKITQLADNINLKVSKSDLISQINVQAGSVLIQSGTNKLNITPTTTYIQNGTIKSAMIESLEADKIKFGTLDGKEVNVINLDAENITSNKTSFVQSVWNSLESSISINATGLLSTASDGSQVYLQNGVVGARNPSGATIGQIGYAYETSSPYYSMQISHGSHFQIRMSRGAGELNKQAFYIISGGTESYLNTDNIYLNPASSGRVRVQGAMTVDKDIRAEGTVLVRSKLEYLNGGFIESQSANSNMLIASTNKLIMYTNGTSALEIDSSHAVFRRKISENSDVRLKTNIVDMPIDSLDAIRNMEIKKFDYLDGRKNYYGIIAQQAQQYLPELINTDSEGYLMVDKSAMTYVNMHAIQQLDSRVDDVNDEVTQLKAQVASLQDELAQLKGD